jgi:hypothetical protein
MTEIPRNPVEWTLNTWMWVAFVVAFGGVYNWLSKAREAGATGDRRRCSIVSLLGELALCELVGIPVFMALHGGTELAVGLTVAAAIAAGHYGTRFICKVDAFANAYACKATGLSQADIRAFEQEGYASGCIGGCFDFGYAFALLKQGLPVRHVLWPEGQWVAMPPDSAIPVKASSLWPDPAPGAGYARRLADQTVLVLPAITLRLPDGRTAAGWTPSVTDLLIPGWSRLEDGEGTATDTTGTTGTDTTGTDKQETPPP